MQEVICREILDQVTHQTLNQQRKDDGLWDIPFRVLRFFTHRSNGFESNENQDRDTRLDEHIVEVVWCHDRCSRVVILELVYHHFGIIGRRSLLKRHRIVDGEILLLAVRSLGNYKIALRILNGLSILVCGKDLGYRRSIWVERDSHGSLRMVQAITHSDNRKHDQSRNLDDVNRCVHSRCAGDAAETNIGDSNSKKWTKDDHEQWTGDGCVEGIRPDLPHHIADDESRNTNHQSWINPVIKVARPTHHEFRDSCESVRFCLTEKRLLGEEIRGTRSRIELR